MPCYINTHYSIADSSMMHSGGRSTTVTRERLSVTAPASTFATPVASLSFSGADYDDTGKAEEIGYDMLV